MGLATEEEVRQACKRVRVDPAKRWYAGLLSGWCSLLTHRWVAERIVGERTVGEGEAARTEYLVKFKGYKEPEWASEVTDKMIGFWERAKKDNVAAHLEAVCAPGAEPAEVTQDQITAFQIKALLAGVHGKLVRGLKFSGKVKECVVRRHNVRVPFMVEVCACSMPCSHYRPSRPFSSPSCALWRTRARSIACSAAMASRLFCTRLP